MSYTSLDELSDPTPMSPSPDRSHDYYWEVVILQVEDTLFRIPKHQLVGKSEAFASMLSLPQGSNEPEGFSDDRPIQLSGIKKIDFERLLQVIYPLDTEKPPELSLNGWISVLALSNLWRMTMRKAAIEHLTSKLSEISPVDRVLLGRKYSVANFISSGYEELASRVGIVSLEDSERIGLGTALKIQHIRESLFMERGVIQNSYYCVGCRRYNTYSGSYPSAPPFAANVVKEKVGSLFEAELKDVEAEGARFG
ncbi:hypothetical protein EDD18DRAFT_1255532 [Armillaria luteobubalina]|uniref:BTB domain-containing protein n=1 Tax=Armillaria luteobubalina TaxID=153913 RepID=A0AA39Q2E5_9AGAR|nr:hypothetical protein EDD18DRAFT_1255532 [Armillaria luteobubalina]